MPGGIGSSDGSGLFGYTLGLLERTHLPDFFLLFHISAPSSYKALPELPYVLWRVVRIALWL
jgi:hypothetical protein